MMAKNDLKQNVVELIERNRYSKLITFGPDNAPRGRIMTNLPLGKDMVIWFATGLSTSKIKDIKKNPNVSVFVDDANDLTNASITGKAEIVTDARLLKKFWQEPFGFFFPGGPSDRDYCLLKIIPKKVEYLNPGPMFLQNRLRMTVKL
jgi:general stress protein 26